jgi:hypothetical protein
MGHLEEARAFWNNIAPAPSLLILFQRMQVYYCSKSQPAFAWGRISIAVAVQPTTGDDPSGPEL